MAGPSTAAPSTANDAVFEYPIATKHRPSPRNVTVCHQKIGQKRSKVHYPSVSKPNSHRNTIDVEILDGFPTKHIGASLLEQCRDTRRHSKESHRSIAPGASLLEQARGHTVFIAAQAGF